MQSNSYPHIVILGAGPAGSSAALFFAQKGIPCTVIEKSTFPRDKTCGDALSGKVFEVLQHLDPNILQTFLQNDKAMPCWGIQFIAPNGLKANIPFKKDFAVQPATLPSGFIMKRFDFDNYLYHKCLQYPSIALKTGVSYTQIQKHEGGYTLVLSNGEHIDAQFILCADGVQSKFARTCGNMQIDQTYHSGSVRAYFKNVKGFEKGNFLELYFLKDVLPGYFWIFPLPNGEANIGLGLRSDYISKHKVDLKQLFAHIIASDPTVRERLRDAEMIGKLAGFGIPLGSKFGKISGDRYLLLGDAAALVDPFTGEGIGNAVLSGKIAAEVVAEACMQNRFDAEFLQQYDRQIYKKLSDELKLSRKLQNLSIYPWLMNFMIKKASKNREFKDTLTAMFENVDLRAKFKDPKFYLRLLFDKL